MYIVERLKYECEHLFKTKVKHDIDKCNKCKHLSEKTASPYDVYMPINRSFAHVKSNVNRLSISIGVESKDILNDMNNFLDIKIGRIFSKHFVALYTTNISNDLQILVHVSKPLHNIVLILSGDSIQDYLNLIQKFMCNLEKGVFLWVIIDKQNEPLFEYLYSYRIQETKIKQRYRNNKVKCLSSMYTVTEIEPFLQYLKTNSGRVTISKLLKQNTSCSALCNYRMNPKKTFFSFG
jgi:hypothetical protein